jgi:phage gp36-like protein
MANYLKHDNHLIVWPVLTPDTESELCTSHIGMRARYNMLTKELLDDCLEMYKADTEKSYRFVLKRAAGDIEIPLDQTVEEVGMRNGDYLHTIVA